MAYELIYTSAPRGIRPGNSGFCIVAYTNGLSGHLALQLEALSGYKPYFPHYDPNASRNPVACSHYMYGEHHILSRVCFCGQDYTKRSNKLAHHLVLSAQEVLQTASGPTAVFRQENIFLPVWNQEPQLFPHQKTLCPPVIPLRRATRWEAYAGDAGWAGVLAQRWREKPEMPAFILFDPLRHSDILGLAEEALLLLTPEERWQVTFHTCFHSLPAGVSCAWRFCVPDSEALREARRTPECLIIDLTRPLPQAAEGSLVEVARSGIPACLPVASQPENAGPSGPLRLKSTPKPAPFLAPLPAKPSTMEEKTSSGRRWRLWSLLAAIIVIAAGVFWGADYLLAGMPPPATESASTESPQKSHKHIAETSEDTKTYAESPVVVEPNTLDFNHSRPHASLVPATQEELCSEPQNAVVSPVSSLPPALVPVAAELWWLDKPLAGFYQAGADTELKFDLLQAGEIPLEVKIQNWPEWIRIEDGHVTGSRYIGVDPHRIFDYKVTVKDGSLVLAGPLRDAQYGIEEIRTDRNRRLCPNFTPGVSRLPENPESVYLSLAHSNEQWLLSYNADARIWQALSSLPQNDWSLRVKTQFRELRLKGNLSGAPIVAISQELSQNRQALEECNELIRIWELLKSNEKKIIAHYQNAENTTPLGQAMVNTKELGNLPSQFALENFLISEDMRRNVSPGRFAASLHFSFEQCKRQKERLLQDANTISLEFEQFLRQAEITLEFYQAGEWSEVQKLRITNGNL